MTPPKFFRNRDDAKWHDMFARVAEIGHLDWARQLQPCDLSDWEVLC
jgi:hypothetical protein